LPPSNRSIYPATSNTSSPTRSASRLRWSGLGLSGCPLARQPA
jgi:hypothetical protein